MNLLIDVINPIDAIWAKAQHGPMHRFSFSPTTTISGLSVERLLRQYGVRMWGRDTRHNDEFAFLVKKSQAEWAEYLLLRAGVVLKTPLINPDNLTSYPQHDSMPTPWSDEGLKPQSFVDHLIDWLDRLLG